METKLEDERLEKDRAMKHLKEEKSLTSKLRSELEKKQDLELEQTSRIKCSQSTTRISTARLRRRRSWKRIYALSSTVLLAERHSDPELREQELKNEELLAVQNKNTKMIAQLKDDLKKQEQQHLADARAVKLSIVSLQDALMEKVSTVEQLVKTTKTTKVKAKALQELEETERVASTRRNATRRR